MMTPRALVALCLVSAAAAGPLLGKVMSRPDASPNVETERQLQADLAELEARKARARGDVLEPPPPPPDDGKHPRRGSRRADSELPSPRSDTPSGSVRRVAPRALRVAARIAPLGVVTAIAVGSVVERQRVGRAQFRIEGAWARLERLFPADANGRPPPCPRARSVRQASELEERIGVLADVLPQARDDRPMAAQLPHAKSVISHPQYANLGLAAPSSLLDADAISLAEINATLAARTEACALCDRVVAAAARGWLAAAVHDLTVFLAFRCGLVLAGYESLGQRPPPDFRNEPLPWLQACRRTTVSAPSLRHLGA